MRISSAAVCILLMAGCGGGTSDQLAVTLPALEASSNSDPVEVKSSENWGTRAVRAAFDNAMLAFNKVRTQEELDKVGDALLKVQ